MVEPTKNACTINSTIAPDVKNDFVNKLNVVLFTLSIGSSNDTDLENVNLLTVRCFDINRSTVDTHFLDVVVTTQLTFTCSKPSINRYTRERYEICSKLKIETQGRSYWCHSGVFIVNFFTPFSSVSILDSEKVNINSGISKRSLLFQGFLTKSFS